MPRGICICDGRRLIMEKGGWEEREGHSVFVWGVVDVKRVPERTVLKYVSMSIYIFAHAVRLRNFRLRGFPKDY